MLLANGAAVPISQLKPGEKVLATNTKTGKTQAETVTAVMVHHDTDLYDLKVRANGKTVVIDTTSNHLFWTPGTDGHSGRWIKAGALKYGTHLRTPSGSNTAVVVGGWVPPQRDGWMWDLTVPGGNDHDFYIDTVATAVLVHNMCPVKQTPLPKWKQCVFSIMAAVGYFHSAGSGDIVLARDKPVSGYTFEYRQPDDPGAAPPTPGGGGGGGGSGKGC